MIGWKRGGPGQREQIEDRLGAVHINLSRAELERLDEVSRIELGFPHDFRRPGFAYDNTFALVDQHHRTLSTELEGPPVIARAEEDRLPAA
jgi:hypothetical protein